MRMTIRRKLYGGFSIVLMFLIFVFIGSYVLTSRINSSYSNLIGNTVTIVNHIKGLSSAISEEQASVNYYLITGDPVYLEAYQQAFNSYNEKSKVIAELINDKEGWRTLQGLDLIQEQYVIAADQMIDDKGKNKVEKYTSSAGSQGKLVQTFSAVSEEFVKTQEDILSKEIDDTKKMADSAKIIITVITLIALVLGLYISLWISNLISKPIIKLSKEAAKIAEGDLTGEEIKNNSDDEISELVKAFNKMTNGLRDILAEVGAAASQVAGSAEDLFEGSKQSKEAIKYVATITQEVATGTDREVVSVDEGVQSVREMNNEASAIDTKSYDVREQVVKASNVIVEGNEAVHKAVRQMNSIQYTVAEIAKIVRELGNESNKINEIIGLITDIASQTNLLSLNASIEAARAGEAGKGFAVVASEVSKLADQTATSGKQVSEVINNILIKTNKTIDAVIQSEREVRDGIEAVNKAGTSFEIIENSIGEVRDTIEDVSIACKHMSKDTEQLVENFETINEITKNVAEGSRNVSAYTEEQLATMEEVENSAAMLSQMSSHLLELISKFRIK
ncbi:methyl-accepting chemotaxis protein [Clostridium cellulovorans]|uniref:Methyl-accepting chemotaxis sensory transducer n=1 Tax=Clostridium cellulovorans (strain ATCC 35296 / DSM 3052 / OCM 3 / 743B) TaxID=573061 RepID=D9STP3_CLOC7|nr:methyl-accepting chemotaxis protein [Clostridium cellulovorans]ADL52777.1 methyl-accepting chemotaxis sensory transducer [Clostridium cellulovorans 743B]